MLRGYNFIYFGPEKWEGLWRNRHQLMSRFSHLNKVLYVEPTYYLKNIRMKLNYGNIIWKDLYNDMKKNHLNKISNSLYIYHSPKFIPISGRFPLDKVSMYFWKIFFKFVLIKIKFKFPIIWLSRPDMADYIGQFNEKLLIYHVVDEYLAYAGINKDKKKIIVNKEKLILQKADLVLVVSQNLLKSKKLYNKNTYLIPNAVDFQKYSKALFSNRKMPEDIANLAKPLIGYSGRIGAKLDFDLLYDLAVHQPDWSVAFVGIVDTRYCKSSFERLQALKNVHFLGLKNISVLAEYIKAFDVCILPYLINEHSKNISPLKLYDYMALGKPIVTTNIPEAHQFKKVIKIASSKKEFIGHVRDSLLEDNEQLVEKRILLASQNTWEDRIEQIEKLIKHRLKEINCYGKYNFR